MNSHEPEEPVLLPIEDMIDLHTFRPADVPDLLSEYLSACVEKKIYSVCIVHGKGQGILKKLVRRCLSGHPLVISFRDAASHSGGWGATQAELREKACR